MPRFTVSTAILLGLAAAGGGAETLDLASAMRLARERTAEVAAAEHRVEAGEAKLRQARGYRLPGVSLQEMWIRTDSPAEAFALQLNQERFSFPEFVAGDPNDPATLEAATTRLELSLPVYTGGELSGRIGQARLAAEAARHDAAWTGDRVALAAAEAYLGLTQVREHVALLERSLETVEGHVDVARAYTEQGMLVGSELLRAEVERSRVADLLTAARGMARVAEAHLSFRLAAAPETAWALAPLAPPAVLGEPLETWLERAAARRDLEAARRMLGVAELEVEVRQSALRPKVALAARRDLVDDAPFGSHGDSTALVVMASLDLFSGGRHRAATAAARAEERAAAAEVAQFEEAIALQVREAYEQALSARDRHRTATAALEAAAEAERITAERFQQGVARMIDLLDASTARRETETRELVARSEAHLATFRLAVAAGRSPESGLPATATAQNPPDREAVLPRSES